MGNRFCFRIKRYDKEEPGWTVVPIQDPLMRLVTRRLVRAEVTRDFDFQPQVLGTGYSGKVRLAVERKTGQQVAIKSFRLNRLKPHQLKLLKGEVEVYLRLDHPNICRLLHAYEGKRDVWLVMELCDSELYTHLCRRKSYSERDAADIMEQMLQAVNYLHQRHVVHRDLKLENWMYGAPRQDAAGDRLRLIDFGFSRILRGDEFLDMPCGTLHYTSPDVLNRKYTSKCDMWSLGVIGYMLVVGRPPFHGSNNMRIAKAIIRGKVHEHARWTALSHQARDFLCKLLHTDMSQRMSASVALMHPWIIDARCSRARKGCVSEFGLRSIGENVLGSIKKFAQSSHLRRAALTVLAYSLTSEDLRDLEDSFMAMDTSRRGTITLRDLGRAMKKLSISSMEIDRILKCFDVIGYESEPAEVNYTAFVASMLCTRVRLYEDKVRSAFEAFDRQGSGYITVDSLVQLSESGESPRGALTREEAEIWIREADYKGNGVVDYDAFLAAIHGRCLFAPSSLDAGPTVRVFEDDGRSRGLSDVLLPAETRPRTGAVRGWWRRSACASLLSGRAEGRRRPRSFSEEGSSLANVYVRSVSIVLDERHFV